MTVGNEQFELSTVLARARREANAEDFGPDEFIEPLKSWLNFSQNASFTESGRAAFLDLVQRCLVNRLRFARDAAQHPEIYDEDVSDPIIVLGFPRSGTTVLQRMLSADPSVQSLYLWRVLNPAPFPGEQPGSPLERLAFARSVEDAIKTHKPGLFAAHPSIADDAEEDWFMHHLTFGHVLNMCCGPFTEQYWSYLKTLPRIETYKYIGNLLRYLQWQDGGKRGRPWILKSPAHIGYLDELLEVHPEATFIYPRRDFRTVMASFCYALESSLAGSFVIDPHVLGKLSLSLWAEEMARFYASARRLGDRLKLIEIPYIELLSDPIPHIEQIHHQAGRTLNNTGKAAIQTWIDNNPPNKHGKNAYTLEHYGLTDEAVADAFGSFEGGLTAGRS